MWSHAVCLVLWITCVTSGFLFDLEYGPPVDEAAQELGYPAERLVVNTSDGYILGVFRILGAKNESVQPGPSTKPVVLCMHGIGLNADSWIFLGQDSLPYRLADAGYDVWMGSTRGSIYSRKHISLPDGSSAFWDFSWDDIGMKDLPAMIDLIVNTTGKPQMQYVGHSMGTTELLVFGSLQPELAKRRLSHAYLLAPAGNLWHMAIATRALILALIAIENTPVLHHLLHSEIPFSRRLVRAFMVTFCTSTISYRFCRLAVDATMGKSKHLTFTRDEMRMIFKVYGLDSGSYKQLNHYRQNSRKAGIFQRYYYGNRNIDVYGSPQPPQYPVQNISIPITAYYGISDKAANIKDVHVLLNQLPKVKRAEPLPFGHLHFLLSRKGSDSFYPKLINNMIDDVSRS